MTPSTNHRRRAFAAVAALLGVALVLLAPPAGAQEDPYGSTTTTDAPAVSPECEVELTAGADGVDALVSLSTVPLGAEVRILLDGDEVARDTAPAESPSGDGTTPLDIPFSVRELPSAPFEITAVGADFTATCELGGALVLGESITRPDGGSGGAFGVSGLPRTGVYVALLLVIALLLVVGGRALVGASRRRQEEAERQARARRRRSTPVAR